MAEVFLCKSGELTAASRRQLKAAGVVVVEVEDPSACQFIRAGETVSSGDMLWAAVDALRRNPDNYHKEVSSKHREHFALNLFELIEAQRPVAPKAPEAGSA